MRYHQTWWIWTSGKIWSRAVLVVASFRKTLKFCAQPHQSAIDNVDHQAQEIADLCSRDKAQRHC